MSEAARMPATDAVGRTIREILKEGTAAEHDMLDARLGSLVLADRDGYAQFLDIQYRARRGVERWLEARALGDPPPPQSDLVARDLASLGQAIPEETPDFTAAVDEDTLGVCWVLAGSALGNRAILMRLAKAQADVPTAFLADPRMGQYWRSMLPALTRPCDSCEHDSVLRAARATFTHFNLVASQCLALKAA
jgi:heme oxygenase